MGGHRVLFRLSAAMPSAGTLRQLLALGLLVETRLELVAQRQGGGTARRALEDRRSVVMMEQAVVIVGDHVDAS
jgi:hypothetical protein